MVGNVITSAPSASSRSASAPACARGRVTTTRRPKSGRSSNHAIRSRSVTTLPTTTTPGAVSPAARTRAASVPAVATTVACAPVVPLWIAAAGVSAASPCAMSAAMIAAICRIPMRKTSVPPWRASASQGSAGGTVSSPTRAWCPVAMVTSEAWSRCVSGMPA